MITRAIDSDNDWTFGKGKNNYKKDPKAVAQNLKTRLQSFTGDCFFAQAEGIDWFNLLGSNQQAKLRLAVSTCILNTENVLRLLELSTTVSHNRVILIQYKVFTSYGNVADVFTTQVNLGV